VGRGDEEDGVMPGGDENDHLLSPKEVAAKLGVSLNTVGTLIKKQELVARKLGGLWRIRPADVDVDKLRECISQWRIEAICNQIKIR
jgi:excisionase family DNA binding protein